MGYAPCTKYDLHTYLGGFLQKTLHRSPTLSKKMWQSEHVKKNYANSNWPHLISPKNHQVVFGLMFSFGVIFFRLPISWNISTIILSLTFFQRPKTPLNVTCEGVVLGGGFESVLPSHEAYLEDQPLGYVVSSGGKPSHLDLCLVDWGTPSVFFWAAKKKQVPYEIHWSLVV